MRQAIKDMLVAKVASVNGRVYEPQEVAEGVEKPYLLLQAGARWPGPPWGAGIQELEVWCCTDNTSFQGVDALCQEVVQGLQGQSLVWQGASHWVESWGSLGGDALQGSGAGLSRGERFRVVSLAWQPSSCGALDPGTALGLWAQGAFPDLQINPRTWQPTDEAPGLYCRLLGLQSREVSLGLTWLDASLALHVLAPGAEARRRWAYQLGVRLAQEKRLVLEDGSFLSLTQVSALPQGDPFERGQLRVKVRFGVLPEQGQGDEPVQKLDQAYVGGDLKAHVKALS